MVSNVKAESSSSGAGGETLNKKNKKKSGSEYDCEVTCLDGTVVNVSVQKSAKGEVLFNKAVEELSITAKEYVGLLFFNEKKVKLWLDNHKDMKHQIGDCAPKFFFRVKFYEPEPARLQDEYMRYLLYMQLREDIRDGKLTCNEDIYANLGAYTAQAELGDFHLSEHDHNYLDGYEFAPNQSPELLYNINELHKVQRGQTPAQAELNFLEIAKKIPRYGVDVHNAQDADDPVEIGVAPLGVNIYRNEHREYLFKWQYIADIMYNRRKFTIKLKEPYSENDKKKNFVYYFESAKLCKQCYKSCIEYHTFFRLTRPDQPRKKLDSMRLGSSFRYSDRTLYQLRHQNNEAPDEPTRFERAPSMRKPEKKPLADEPEIISIVPVGELNNAPTMKIDEDLVQIEEVDIVEGTNADKFDPEEWEVVEKTLPDGTKKRVRRRVIVVKVVKKPKELAEEDPTGCEEIEIKPGHDDQYDPNEWEIIEKPQQDGTMKRYRRRIIIVTVVKKPEDLVNENEVTIQEVPVDLRNPDDPKYDPEEWELVEKEEPDGSVKKYRRRIYLVKIIRKNEDNPVDEKDCKVEEVEVDVNAMNVDELYNPQEWEPVEKKQPDGTIKTYRRRLYFMKVVKKPSPKNEDGVNYEEKDVVESDPEEYDPEEWEELVKTQPDGTVKKYRRRIVVVQIVNKQPEDTKTRPNDETPQEYVDVSKKPSIVDELPLAQHDEVEETSRYFEKLADHPEFEVFDKEKPDGTIIRVARRRMFVKVDKKPGIKVTVRPSIKPNDDPEHFEDPLSYEEIEIDPEDEYDPKIWEEFEKIQPDGTKKRFRRRYISTCNVILKKPSKSSDSDLQYEEVEIGENEDDVFNPEEWEVVEKELPDGTTKRIRRRVIHIRTTYTTTRYIIQTDGDEEESCMELKPIQAKPILTEEPVATSEQRPKEGVDVDDSLNVDVDMNMDDLLSEINEMSASLHDQTNSDRKPKKTIVEETAEQDFAPKVEHGIDFTDFLPPTNPTTPTSPVDEEERRRWLEEEQREKDGLNATIDSIFTLPDDDEVSRSPLHNYEDTFDEAAINESMDHELAEYGADPTISNEPPKSFVGVNIVIAPTTHDRGPRTAPKPAPRAKKNKPLHSNSSASSNPELDEPFTPREHGQDQSDFHLSHHDGNSEIIYTVTDVSQVEQGRGGFVQAVRNKHEHIAHEEHEASNRSSRIFESPRSSSVFSDSEPNTLKGHVPTRTISFNENDKPVVKKTKAPPAVSVKPTVIVPDESELPEEVLFETNQSQEESHPDLELDIIEATDVPEVETEVVLIREPSRDDITVAPPGSEPGLVETKPLPSFTPRDTTVVKTEIIEVDMTPRGMEFMGDDDQDITITTEYLPTEVITKTITIEGDSTELTEEEIQELLSQAPEELNNLESVTSTQVVRTTTVQKVINGKTVTISGEAGDEDVQRILEQAMANGEISTVTDEDGNVIITAVRDEAVEIDEDGDTDI